MAEIIVLNDENSNDRNEIMAEQVKEILNNVISEESNQEEDEPKVINKEKVSFIRQLQIELEEVERQLQNLESSAPKVIVLETLKKKKRRPKSSPKKLKRPSTSLSAKRAQSDDNDNNLPSIDLPPEVVPQARPVTAPVKSAKASIKSPTTSVIGGKPIAGYEPAVPMKPPQHFIEKAKLMKMAEIDNIMLNPINREAMNQVGADIQSLRPTELQDHAYIIEGFKKQKLTEPMQKLFYEYCEQARVELLATVLAEAEKINSEGQSTSIEASKLQNAIKKVQEEEKEKTKKSKSERIRIANALMNENTSLKDRRAQYDERKAKKEARYNELDERVKERDAKCKERGIKIKEKIEAVKLSKSKNEQDWIESTRNKWKQREEHQKEKAQAVNKEEDMKAKKLFEAEKHRLKVKEDVKALRQNHIKEITSKMEEKEKRAKLDEENRAKKKEEEKVKKYLRQKDRELKATRLQRKQEYIKKNTLERIKEKNFRGQILKELKQATIDERLKARKMEITVKHNQSGALLWERKVLPGPGEYKIKSDFEGFKPGYQPGFKMGDGNPKSELDWIIQRASQTPGPGEYTGENMTTFKSDTPAIQFSKGNSLSDLERRIRKGPETPGPNEYNVGRKYIPDSPAFSMGYFRPKSDLDFQVLRASRLPGPGEYDIEELQRRKTIKQLLLEVEKKRENNV